MPYVTYQGENASLTLHGIRFEPKKPVLIEIESEARKFLDLKEFEVNGEFHIPLEDLTVAQLRDKAKAAGIEGVADMKKAEMIQALRAGENANVDDADTP